MKKLITILSVFLSIFLLSSNKIAQKPNDSLTFEYLNEIVKDYDGNTYQTVKIGSQIWMTENLKVTHYRNGTPIPNVFSNNDWPKSEDGAYCMFNNDSVHYKNNYGLLYNYYSVSNNNKICPEGWHIPTKAECLELINYLGGHEVAGLKLKSTNSDLWTTEQIEATNESGFSGLPAGGRGRFGEVGEVGFYATWWSSSSHDSAYAWHWGLYPNKPGIRSNPGHKASGFSVRCVKNK